MNKLFSRRRKYDESNQKARADKKTPITRATRRLAKPTAPPRWNADIRDINVVWYNVSDFTRAKKFYGETLGLPVARVNEQAGWAEYGFPNQTHLALNLWRGPDPIPPALGGATVTFTCEDVRGAIARLHGKGVRCDDVDEIPGSVILGAFYDPDGNRLQYAQTLAAGM